MANPGGILLVEDANLPAFGLGLGLELGDLLARLFPARLDGRGERKRVLIFGAGEAGLRISRDMRRDRAYPATPIGFVDDDPGKLGRAINGARVVGSRQDLPRLLEELRPDILLIAMPSAPARALRAILDAVDDFPVQVQTLPTVSQLIECRVTVGDIRALSVEDLLDRPPVKLDDAEVRERLRGRRVLVTGAGGSIGSELCRQIGGYGPAQLIMLDRYENGLYAVQTELAARRAGLNLTTLVGDVTDAARIEQVFEQHRPQVIFHAAAHKHVPLMEENPCEALKNNVLGTFNVATAADRFQAERFILISTDKAVNPTSVMGASKRVAERIIRTIGWDSRTLFAAVRFGNVLGSNGSVVPLFLQQIETGGPITVTHPEIRRYFMMVSEAVLLVLHASTITTGCETFVLNMGEQVPIVNLARNLIRLSGLTPDVDIEITFSGLRPGEKLYEELVGAGESAEPSEREFIQRLLHRADERIPDLAGVLEQIGRVAYGGDSLAARELLFELVPSFQTARSARPALAAPAALVEADAEPRPRGRSVDPTGGSLEVA